MNGPVRALLLTPFPVLAGPATLLVLALVAVLAGAGTVGVTSLTDDVEVVVDDLRPAVYSNIAVRNDVSQAQLSRAMLNLVTNAVKFSAPGDLALLMVFRLDGEAVVPVVDNGIGIPAAEQAMLGTRFFRASNAAEAEIGGTGLGLRIVQTIAHNHGGRLEIESTEGEGTTSRLVVPAVGEARHRNIGQPEGITQG